MLVDCSEDKYNPHEVQQMKTVQELLQQTDRQQLIDNYLLKYPLEVEDFATTKTIGEVEEAARQQLASYLERLAMIEIAERQDPYVFYAYHHVEKGIPAPVFALANLAELQQLGDEAPTYSYLYSSHADIMGFLVAENKLTQHYQAELLVEIMHEAAFFGFQQEDLPSSQQKLASLSSLQLTEADDQPLPPSDMFSDQEQQLVKQIRDLQSRIADSSQHNAIAEIIQDL